MRRRRFGIILPGPPANRIGSRRQTGDSQPALLIRGPLAHGPTPPVLLPSLRKDMRPGYRLPGFIHGGHHQLAGRLQLEVTQVGALRADGEFVGQVAPHVAFDFDPVPRHCTRQQPRAESSILISLAGKEAATVRVHHDARQWLPRIRRYQSQLDRRGLFGPQLRRGVSPSLDLQPLPVTIGVGLLSGGLPGRLHVTNRERVVIPGRHLGKEEVTLGVAKDRGNSGPNPSPRLGPPV